MNFIKSLSVLVFIGMASSALGQTPTATITNKTNDPVKVIVKDKQGNVLKSVDTLPKDGELALDKKLNLIGTVEVNNTPLVQCVTPVKADPKSISEQTTGTNYDTIEIMKTPKGNLYLECKMSAIEIII